MTYQPQPVMRLSSILMIHQAAQAGRGAAILPWSLVAGESAPAGSQLGACPQPPHRGLGPACLLARLTAAQRTRRFAAFFLRLPQFPDGRLKLKPVDA